MHVHASSRRDIFEQGLTHKIWIGLFKRDCRESSYIKENGRGAVQVTRSDWVKVR